MNTNLLSIVKQIVADNGESVLDNPKRVSAFLADLAKDEPKSQKTTLVKCLEYGFVQPLKNAAETDRSECKKTLAQRLHDEEGLDLTLCTDIVALLAAVLFEKYDKENSKKILCKKCGKEFQEGWKVCPYCGWQFAESREQPKPKPQTVAAAASNIINRGEATEKQLQVFKKAITAFTQALRLDPNNSIYYRERGRVYDDNGEPDKAIADYNNAIKMAPNDAKAYRYRGDAYLHKISTFKDSRDYSEQAINDFIEAIRLNLEMAYYSFRGQGYFYKKDYDLAIADFETALHLNPAEASRYGIPQWLENAQKEKKWWRWLLGD